MDRRIKYTKNIIKETVFNLLETKEINKISVTEICRIADINRATFYRYYLDVFDLLKQIQDEFVSELLNSIKRSEQYSVFSFSKEYLEVLNNNQKLVKILFTNKNFDFLSDILELSYEQCEAKWLKLNPDISKEKIEYASVFIFNGALGIVNLWIQNDFDKSIEEVASTIEDLSYHGIQKYILAKKK